jgi:hypothetical protein
MSALAVRVGSDKQTLILAGEPIPPRSDAARSDDGGSATGGRLRHVTMLLVQGEYDAPAASVQHIVPSPASGRMMSGGAAEYARMQNLSGASRRIPLIDTYA